ncbi:hypothetical protein [Blastococcus sp. Marseille-P5729]|uniref:hypothetical protein n=1 Tax=Blastococcus sp. Marseille-P5729 TaxID=2086582 RepID=UPI000D1138D4|nr:hypothetical protein [Blastococcus sp. Marseille-P5729]
MVRRIIPVNKVAEDADSVTYEWGHPTVNRKARIVKSTDQIEPAEGTTEDEAQYLLNWINRVRVLNNMSDYPSEAPIYR